MSLPISVAVADRSSAFSSAKALLAAAGMYISRYPCEDWTVNQL